MLQINLLVDILFSYMYANNDNGNFLISFFAVSGEKVMNAESTARNYIASATTYNKPYLT